MRAIIETAKVMAGFAAYLAVSPFIGRTLLPVAETLSDAIAYVIRFGH